MLVVTKYTYINISFQNRPLSPEITIRPSRPIRRQSKGSVGNSLFELCVRVGEGEGRRKCLLLP